MSRPAQAPSEGFTPIEYTPVRVEDFKPIEVTPYVTPEAAPATATEKPASGQKEN